MEGKRILHNRVLPQERERTISRARVDDFKFEKVASFRDLRLAWPWMGVTPDDSPVLLLRDVGTEDIYVLDWEAP